MPDTLISLGQYTHLHHFSFQIILLGSKPNIEKLYLFYYCSVSIYYKSKTWFHYYCVIGMCRYLHTRKIYIETTITKNIH